MSSDLSVLRRFVTLVGVVLLAAGVAVPASADDVVVGDNPFGAGDATGVEAGWEVSPDGRWVVYRADFADDGVEAFRLYASFLDGSEVEPIALSEPGVAGGDVSTFRITPDSSSVVFVGDLLVDERFDLFSRSIDGVGDQEQLSAIADDGGDVAGFLVSPDGAWVAYRGDTLVDDRTEVFGVPVDGSANRVRLNAPGLAGSDVTVTMRFTPDSSRLVFRADLEVDDRHDLYVRDIEGTGPQARITGVPVAGGEVSLNFSVTDTHAVFTGDLVVDDEVGIFSVLLDGTQPQAQLSDASDNPGGDVLDPFDVTPDGSRAVWVGDLVADNTFELYTAPVDGSGAQAAISGPVVAGGDVVPFTVEITPDASRAVFIGDLDTDGVEELYSAGLTGTGRVDLSEDRAVEVDLHDIAPDGTVVFRADLDDFGGIDVWSTSADGSGPLRQLSVDEDGTGDVQEVFLADDGSRVVYIGELDSTDFEVYSRQLDGSTPQVRIGDLQIVVFGGNAVISPDGRYVLRRLTTADDLVATTDGQVPRTTRVAGADRYATAVAVSQQAFSPRVPVAYVATGVDFPDALSAGPVAARDRGPVLLTPPDALPASTEAELERLRPRAIVVLGGAGAVSDTVVAQLEGLTDGAVTRLSGPDRYATSVAISSQFPPGVDVAYVTTGTNFPDALAGGALARDDGPILLVQPDAIPSAVADELERLDPDRIVVLGGEAAVSTGVATSLAAYTPNPVERLAGADRFLTAVEISGEFPERSDTLYVATGANFPDALAASSAAVRDRASILLVPGDDVSVAVVDEATRLAPRRIIVLGGAGAVSDGVAAAFEPALRAPEEP